MLLICRRSYSMFSTVFFVYLSVSLFLPLRKHVKLLNPCSPGITAIYATNQHGLSSAIWWEVIMLHCKNIKQKLPRSLSFICF